ncbi:MAG: SpoIID/LytB domain-containing protein [Elusimicrobia bacterium]|nr:SpoIID/LytB domain-containing protein [Elusimicrobiota bacterium]
MITVLIHLVLTLPLRAEPRAPALVARGNALYFQGEYAKAVDAYAQAVKASSMTASAWLNGAQVLEETGQLKEAVRWYRRAASLSSDPAVLGALGWAQWRGRQFEEAAATFERALRRKPDDASSLLGAARAALERSVPMDAVTFLEKAADAAPLLNLVPYYQGQAYEELKDDASAIETYKRAVIGDSYFVEAREALGRVYLRRRDYNDAWRQFSKVLDAEPHSKRVQLLVDRVAPYLTRRPSELRPTGLHKPIPYIVESPAGGPKVPLIRVGIGTNAVGKPRPRQSVSFKITEAFDVADAATGKKLGEGDADDAWSVRVRRIKKKAQLLLVDSDGKTLSQKSKAVVVRPRNPAKAVVILDDVPGTGGNAVTAGRALRGQLEVALFKGGLRLVNIVDLENYTHGVVSSEMPIKSPIEALKAQAVMARTHALYIKKLTRRHKKEGFDLCDGDHCQVYGGVRSESERSRQIVEATRGRVVTYKGRPSQVIYSSNCGGFTQSGKDVTGWGDVPYWKGMSDGPELGPRPASPWELRQWLWSSPAAYCKPSSDVHPSHFRWTRVVATRDLEDKFDKKFKTGKLRALRPLRRSSAGNVNVLQIVGSRRKVKLDSEMQIRSLLGLGSLRSTLFIIETEYDAKDHPVRLIFHGAGWGHGVGLCQSGAMGRAEAGQSYEQIIKAYFKDVELSELRY